MARPITGTTRTGRIDRRQMVGAGYATLNIERLGYGRSTHPPSTSVTLPVGTEALRQVVDKLRSGEIGGHPFSRVIWVGHSLGTLYGWLEASVSQNVDAFVLTGLLHSVKPSWLALANQSAYPATLDASFATLGFDSGYLTFRPGRRAPLFYWTPTVDPNVIALDERLKDTVSETEFGAAVPLFNSPPPLTAPSQAIKVPTLVVVGQHDPVVCDEDGLICNQQNVASAERPYYPPAARLQVYVALDTGHDLQLHETAPATGERILSWLSTLHIAFRGQVNQLRKSRKVSHLDYAVSEEPWEHRMPTTAALTPQQHELAVLRASGRSVGTACLIMAFCAVIAVAA
jgi:pimeloyl-ACP methyl ester carboxylesterase